MIGFITELIKHRLSHTHLWFVRRTVVKTVFNGYTCVYAEKALRSFNTQMHHPEVHYSEVAARCWPPFGCDATLTNWHVSRTHSHSQANNKIANGITQHGLPVTGDDNGGVGIDDNNAADNNAGWRYMLC